MLYYNQDKRKGEIVMKWQVRDSKGFFFPSYYNTKREAMQALAEKGERFSLYKKIGGNWFPA